jgi:glycosyltransferase involved in cell wall biosynthesis
MVGMTDPPGPSREDRGEQPVEVWTAGAAPEDAPFLEQMSRVLGRRALHHLGIIRVPRGFQLSVVTPVYNESATIETVLRRVAASPIPKEIIVVDDGSTDGTREILAKLRDELKLRIFLHERNEGKGAALRTGFRQAAGDVVVVQDADLEYDPAEYGRLIAPIVDGLADVVYGSRFKGETERIHLFWHRVANAGLTLLSNLFNNLNLSDMETGCKAFRRSVLAGISIKQNRFGVEPELTAKIARRKYRVYEVAVSYSGRGYAEGKKIRLRDAVNALYSVIRYWIAD